MLGITLVLQKKRWHKKVGFPQIKNQAKQLTVLKFVSYFHAVRNGFCVHHHSSIFTVHNYKIRIMIDISNSCQSGAPRSDMQPPLLLQSYGAWNT